MAPSPTDISAALQSIPEKKESLRKAFEDLEEQRAIISRCSKGWTDIDASLSEIYDTLEKRYAEIVDKETKFEARMAEMQAALEKRESVIESREQASLARVQEQKDAAIAAILEQKRKWNEERKLLQSQSPAKPERDGAGSKSQQDDNKVAQKDDACKTNLRGKEKDDLSLKEKEASLKDRANSGGKKISKESASSKNNQKESADAKLTKAKENNLPSTEAATDRNQETAVKEHGLEKQNADDLKDKPVSMEIGDEDGAKSGDEDGSDDPRDEDEKEGSHKKDKSSQPVRGVSSELKAWPELKALCEKMDGPGLHSFLSSQKKKDVKLIRKELPRAMKYAPDPPKLVLQGIRDYYSENTRDKTMAVHTSCHMLLNSLGVVLDDKGKTGDGVSDDIKQEAKKVAELWKSKVNPDGTDLWSMLDIQRFLQLTAMFGLASNFNEDELVNLAISTRTRKPVLRLWCKLGLTHRIPELAGSLMKDGKLSEAINYVQEYGLAEQFPPASLLKSYLKDIRKAYKYSTSAEDKDEIHKKELSAARAVLKCVEKHKLEADYPTDGLQRRIVQLENLSSEKRRNPDTNAGVLKKPRVNGPSVPPHSGPHGSDRFGGRGTGGLNYGLPYGQGGYPYPAGGPGYGSSYSHGNYPYGGGPPSYQGPYMR